MLGCCWRISLPFTKMNVTAKAIFCKEVMIHQQDLIDWIEGVGWRGTCRWVRSVQAGCLRLRKRCNCWVFFCCVLPGTPARLCVPQLGSALFLLCPWLGADGCHTSPTAWQFPAADSLTLQESAPCGGRESISINFNCFLEHSVILFCLKS